MKSRVVFVWFAQFLVPFNLKCNDRSNSCARDCSSFTKGDDCFTARLLNVGAVWLLVDTNMKSFVYYSMIFPNKARSSVFMTCVRLKISAWLSISKKKQGVFKSYAAVSCCTLLFSGELLLLCRKGTEPLSRDRSETHGHTCANKTDPSLHFNSMNCSVILCVFKRRAHEQKKSVNTYESNQVLWLLLFFFFFFF